MLLNLKYPPTPDHASDHAAVCVSAVHEISGVSLDYSPASLDALDAIIEDMRRGGVSSDQVAETLFSFGCYVGEVFVRHAGAAWRNEADTAMKGLSGFSMVLELGHEHFCNPIGKVFKRLDNGAEDSLPYFYTVFSNQSPSPPPAQSAPKVSWMRRLFGRRRLSSGGA